MLIVVAPSSSAAAITSATNPRSERVASSHENSTSSPIVRLARTMVEDVEFSCEDATRSDRGFVAEVIAAALEEGATTINIPDTVGYTMPTEFQGFLLELYERCPRLRDAT